MFKCEFHVSYVLVQQQIQGPIEVMDPSLLLRPEPTFAAKPVGMFRDYAEDPEDPIKERVRQTYLKMHTYQTVDFVRGKNFYLNIKNLK